jgi:hypothetical protein
LIKNKLVSEVIKTGQDLLSSSQYNEEMNDYLKKTIKVLKDLSNHIDLNSNNSNKSLCIDNKEKK